MPYGRGWELIEPEAFFESVEREVANDPRVEDMLEGLSFALIMDPTDPSLAFRISGTLWCAPLSGEGAPGAPLCLRHLPPRSGGRGEMETTRKSPEGEQWDQARQRRGWPPL